MYEAARSTPRYDVSYDNDAGIVELNMELPGVLAKDLVVELENDRMLRIKGSRKYKNGESEFDQVFQLDDDVDPERITVNLSAGILTVRASKKERLVKRIEVTTAEDEPAVEDKPQEIDGLTITEED